MHIDAHALINLAVQVHEHEHVYAHVHAIMPAPCDVQQTQLCSRAKWWRQHRRQAALSPGWPSVHSCMGSAAAPADAGPTPIKEESLVSRAERRQS